MPVLPRRRLFSALFRHLCATTVLLAAVSSQAAAAPQVRFDTSMGSFTVELNPEKAPRTVENFIAYVKGGQYSETIFHRVIDGFMIQGGGFTPDMQEKPTRGPIDIESNNGLKNLAGTIAMARTADPNSARAQFYINVVDNPFLDFTAPTARGIGYTVFGKVVSGMDVVNRIKAVRTTSYGPYSNVPATPVVIKSATLIGN